MDDLIGLSRQDHNRLTLNDLQRAADAVSDLDDPTIMEQAWR